MADDAEARDSAASTRATPPGAGRRPLSRGDTLAGRFVIVQFLAAGGMGEVYEAADLQLQGKHCALKTLKPGVAQNSELRLRFEREVLLAREVTHPNVCPTYDIFQVQEPDGPLIFFTMKLLRGESLMARLKRLGPVGPDALGPLARQMADALDAAHRAGVVHRDFKPGNVMLEHSSQADPRVCITDFGLSRAHESDITLGDTGQVLGTPGYIAPELIQGRVASFSADVYAFGVVLHEMATGKKPVQGSAASGFVRPSTLSPELPRVWDRIILGCLEPDPGARFQSAGEAMALLDAETSGSQTRSMRARVRRRRLRIGGGLAAAAALAAAWFALPPLDALLHPLPAKRFVATMAWPPTAKAEHRPLLKGVLDAVGSRLARAESTTKDFLIMSQSDVTGSTLAKPVDAVGALGVNLVLAASVEDAADGIALDLAVLDASTAKPLRKGALRVSNAELNYLPDRAAVLAAGLLDVRLSPTQWTDREHLSGVSPAAYQLFARAEDLMSLPNSAGIDQALEQYQKALETEPAFALAYASLSLAYSRKFQLSRDRSYLSLAERNADLALRYNSGSGKGALARATVDVLSGRPQEAIDGVQRALRTSPGDPQLLQAKARVFRDLDRRADEEAVYRQIIAERPNFWPGYQGLGLSLYRHGNYEKAAAAFAEGLAVAPRVVSLLNNLGAMYLLLKRNADAEAAFLRSVQLTPSEAAYLNLGTIAFEARDFSSALKYYVQARELNPRNDSVWRNIGDSYAMLGDAARVQESYAKAANLLSQALSTNPQRGSSWMTLAFYEAKRGRREEAEAALRHAEERGATDLDSQFKKAQALALLGRKEDALTLVIECVKRGLSPASIELALDLGEVRSDPRYQQAVAAR